MNKTKYCEYTERCLNCKHFGWDERFQTEWCAPKINTMSQLNRIMDATA